MPIVFASTRSGGLNYEMIYMTNADEASVVRLTNNPGIAGDPSLSPDDNRIAFGRGTRTGSEIYVMDVDGSDVARLTDNTPGDSTPT